MKIAYALLIALSVCLILSLLLSGCQNGDNGTTPEQVTVLAEGDLTVPSGGGGVEFPFWAEAGQTIRITLTASSNMQPFGYLEYPNGGGDYYPPQNTAQNGTNSVELTLTQTGLYQLVLFDGNNAGGSVHVKVEAL